MNVLGIKKISFIETLCTAVSFAGYLSYESRLDRIYLMACVRRSVREVCNATNARRRYDERRQVWKNSFLSRQVQVAHVGIKRINIRGVIVRAIYRACRHAHARAQCKIFVTRNKIHGERIVALASLLRAISRPRCALIHTFVFRLPRFYRNTARTRLLIAARASSRSKETIGHVYRLRP